jgi:outer membrane lipoprotein carrier protein
VSAKQAVLLVATLPLFAAPDLQTVLRAVENRYNSPRTMQLNFEQSFSAQGRMTRSESGILYLQKPGRMRWDYQTPEGKLFLADGKFIWFYSPNLGRVERTPIKESGDLRAPLAFLMGRLDFNRDFKEFRTRPESGGDLAVTALPKSDKSPYTQVEFLITPDARIRVLKVTGQDRSVMSFHLGGEKANPALDANLFRYSPPPGIEVVDVADSN